MSHCYEVGDWVLGPHIKSNINKKESYLTGTVLDIIVELNGKISINVEFDDFVNVSCQLIT